MQQVQETSTTQPMLLTIAQVMELLQLKRTKVNDLIKREGLPVQHFGRAVRIPREELQTWLKAREQ